MEKKTYGQPFSVLDWRDNQLHHQLHRENMKLKGKGFTKEQKVKKETTLSSLSLSVPSASLSVPYRFQCFSQKLCYSYSFLTFQKFANDSYSHPLIKAICRILILLEKNFCTYFPHLAP